MSVSSLVEKHYIPFLLIHSTKEKMLPSFHKMADQLLKWFCGPKENQRGLQSHFLIKIGNGNRTKH